MSITGPTAFYQVASTVLDQVQQEVTTAGFQLHRTGIVPGRIAWDECECGTLVASLGRMWYSNNFPEPATVSQCGAAIICGDITFQILDCAPQPKVGELAPTVTALDASAAEVMATAWIMMTTVACALTGLEDRWEIMGQLVQPLLVTGPEGACVGSEVTASVGVAS